MARHPLTSVSLSRENAAFRGKGGVSAENQSLGFLPAFLDMETGALYRSRFADGSNAPIHVLDGLPDKVVLSRNACGEVSAVKSTVVAGFEREGHFFTREQASRTVTQMRHVSDLLSRPLDQQLLISAWEHFLVDNASLNRRIRPVVEDSWKRCQKADIDPGLGQAPVKVAGEQLESIRQWHATLRRATLPILRKANELLCGSGALILLTDPVGLILDVHGDARAYDKAREINLVEGGLWSETAAGTNAMGTALAIQQPVQIHGGEHFCEGIKRWTCSADVICDPYDGQPLGVLDLSGLADTFDDRYLPFIVATAREIEAALTQDYLRSRRRVVDATIDMSRRWKGDGLLALDSRGRLVKFNIAARAALRRYGIDIALTPQTRVAALDLDLPEQERRRLWPPWLLPQWLQPAKRGKLRVGTLIVIPTTERHAP